MRALALVSSVFGSILVAAFPSVVAQPAPAPPKDVTVRLRAFMDRAAAEGFTGGVVVTREGKALLLAAYGMADADDGVPMRVDSVSTVGSITKQFTAAAVLKLQEQGKLRVTDRIDRYLPGVPEDKQPITIHLLLTHQAGFPGAIGDDRERIGRDAFVRRAMATPLEFAPGERYEYSNVGFSLAAAIVEKVSGLTYEAFLRTYLFEPAGMRDTGYRVDWDPARLAHGVAPDGGDWGTVVEHSLQPDGPGWNLLGNGGIHSTLADMMAWHRALTGDVVLSEESKRQMYARHADEGGGSWYGYGWSLEDTPWGELVTHNGGNGFYFADFLRYVDHDVAIYYFTTSGDRRMNRLGRKLAQIVFTDALPELEPPRQPLIAAAPRAAEGPAAARWGLPDTVRGRRAAELLDAIATTDADARRAFIDAALEPGLVERNGKEKLLRAFDQIRDEVGNLDVQGLEPVGDDRVALVVATGKHPVPLRLILDLEPDEPHRITRIAVEIGD